MRIFDQQRTLTHMKPPWNHIIYTRIHSTWRWSRFANRLTRELRWWAKLHANLNRKLSTEISNPPTIYKYEYIYIYSKHYYVDEVRRTTRLKRRAFFACSCSADRAWFLRFPLRSRARSTAHKRRNEFAFDRVIVYAAACCRYAYLCVMCVFFLTIDADNAAEMEDWSRWVYRWYIRWRSVNLWTVTMDWRFAVWWYKFEIRYFAPMKWMRWPIGGGLCVCVGQVYKKIDTKHDAAE